MAKERRPRQLLPFGNIDKLTTKQQRRAQAYVFINRHIPSGSRTAHNVQVAVDYIIGDDDV